ncbi:extracellular solute-binding protein [Paenibacillus montaniterrae]|uniref:Maltodextrin-binding protein n=1 Tax=Paenibacillus montaniterrae TaxID=429341 RepID=A0A919YTH9_9BACL|nr:extracellular solute-binding protein [Paenibacillus montaniterrae]GIP17869.1 extracellular solute-binding protein [Paenibacillus montaniterrae]
MKTKRILAFAMTTILATTMLSACGPDRSNGGNTNQGTNQSTNQATNTPSSTPEGTDETANQPEKPAELKIWADDNAEKLAALETITKRYTEQTGIAVKITPIAMNDQIQALSLDGPAGNGPDLFYQPGIGSLSVQGLVQPIEISDEVRANFTEDTLGALSYDGNLYGMPFVVETYALLYNKALIPEAPKTIAELEKIAEEQTDASKDQYGFLFNATDFYFAWAFMGGSGGYIFKEDGNGFDISDIGFNQQGAVEGAKLIQSWFDKGYLPKGVNGDVVGGLFNEGKVAAVINGPWAITDHRAQLGDNLAVAPLPVLENGNHPQSFIGVKGWMLSAFSQNAYWATDLAVFLTNAENSLEWFKATGEMPPNLKALEDPAITEDPLVVGFTEQTKYGKPFPNVAELSHVWDPMANALKFISEGQDVQEVMDEAVTQIQDLIKMAGANQ